MFCSLSPPFDQNAVESILGYQFANPELLVAALTHNSLGKERGEQGFVRQHERLEFLGDRVLGLTIAELLYQAHPRENEGALAIRLSALVSGRALAGLATQSGLASHLRYGKTIAQVSEAMLADCFEAVVGALYLDGGAQAASDFIRKVFAESLARAGASAPLVDAKTRLQELSLKQQGALPVYEVLEHSGPDHAPSFRVLVTVGEASAEGTGSSRRGAEQQAAEQLFALLSPQAGKS